LSAAATFVLLDLCIERGAYLRHFQQSWSSHFGATRSFEYGSPMEHAFEWSIFRKHWEGVAPAMLGFCISIARARKLLLCILPAAWLAFSLLVFIPHKPWWSYYYIHLAIPLCWCAAIGLLAAAKSVFGPRTSSGRTYNSRKTALNWLLAAGFALYALCTAGWAGARAFMQVTDIRNSLQTYNCLVLQEMARFKPFTQWLFADEAIFSFHSGIPAPPDLGVVMLKRFWSGEMSNDRLALEMEQYKPGLILLVNDTRVLPFQRLLDTDYALVYADPQFRLYANRSIAKKPYEQD
jgi:hypothetical protein